MKKILAVLFSALLLCTCGAILSACGHEHSYTNYVYNNDAKCEIDGTETATCDNGCGESHTRTKEGSALQHTYTNYEYNNDAECEVDGTETALCDNGCGESRTRTKEDSALTHNYGDWISNGNDTHTKTCSHDSTHKITENCSGGTASETHKAVCSTCGGEHGEKLEHSYINYVYNNDAKCGIDGTETAQCDNNCGESHTRTKANSALEHNYGEWISNGDNTHTKTCSHDSTHIITENCSGGEATCSQKAICSSCNSEYGKLKDHPYSTKWTITETHHYHASTCDCGEKKDYGEHTPDDSGFCTTCDKAINYTKGIIYDYSSDRTYAEVIGYEGSSTKINIAPTYNKLPVKSIYASAFEYTNITKVIIPDSVTSIGEEAFQYCNSLTSIEIPDSVTSIGYAAFFYCSSLTSVTIGGSVTSIGYSTFSYCSSLISVTFEDTSTWYKTDDYENWINKTGGTQMDVTNPTQIASSLKHPYYEYFLYKL